MEVKNLFMAQEHSTLDLVTEEYQEKETPGLKVIEIVEHLIHIVEKHIMTFIIPLHIMKERLLRLEQVMEDVC